MKSELVTKIGGNKGSLKALVIKQADCTEESIISKHLSIPKDQTILLSQIVISN